MGYNDVISLLGNFGRYQQRIYFLLCLSCILSAFHKMGNVFLQTTPDHRCQLINEFPNASYILPPEILNVSLPFDKETKKYSSCSMIQNDEIIPCDGYIYDHRKYLSSIVTEWNLVCDQAYRGALANTVFMVGVMFCAIIFGQLSDKYGRKSVFFVSLTTLVVFGIMVAFSVEYWMYTTCRAVVGAGTDGLYLSAYVIAIEMVGPASRSIVGVVCHMFFSMGYMLTALLAYLITNWRHLQLALTLPAVLYFSYWWFIPESVCWLITKNRIPEAIKLIQTAAEENKITVSDIQIQQLLSVNQKDQLKKQPTVCDIFQHSVLVGRFVVICFNWFVGSMSYYGLSWNTSNLSGNDYLNFIISGAVEIPAYTFLVLTLNKFGCRPIVCGCFVSAGTSLLLTMPVLADQKWLVTTLAMLGKMTITAAFSTMYVISTEQFPTVIRNAGLGAGAMSGRIGSILTQSINLMGEIWKPIPLLVFETLALVSGCVSLILPETLNQRLPETMADWKQLGKTTADATEIKNKYYYNKNLVL